MTAPYLPIRWLVDTPDIADDPDVFPLLPGQMFVSQKGPTWATTVKRTKSGRIIRAGEYSSPIWRFKVAYEVLRQTPGKLELDRLFAFFNQRRGRLGEFFYWDPHDHLVDNEMLGVGNGANRTFQLVRRINGWSEPVYAVYGTPVVTVGGVATSAYTLNDFGVLVLDTAPAGGAAVRWTGQLMFWCSFTRDDLSAQQLFEQLWSSEGVTFESLKP